MQCQRDDVAVELGKKQTVIFVIFFMALFKNDSFVIDSFQKNELAGVYNASGNFAHKNAKLPKSKQEAACSGFWRRVLLDSKYYTMKAGQGDLAKLNYDYFIVFIDYICNGVSNGDNHIMPRRKPKCELDWNVNENKNNGCVYIKIVI